MDCSSNNGFFTQQPQMSYQTIQVVGEGGSSSMGNSCNKPPRPVFNPPPLVDETHHVLSINNQNRSNDVAMAEANANIGRVCMMTDQELIEYEQKNGRTIDPNTVDMKKLKRTIANRLSAQKSRLKKTHQIEEMEKKVRTLEETISAIKIQMESATKTKEMLSMNNIEMKQKLDHLSNKATETDKEIEKNKVELTWLKDFVQIMKHNAMVKAEKKMMESLCIDHYDQLLPDFEMPQAFSLPPNGEHQDATMGGHADIPDLFPNMEEMLHFQQSINPAN